MACPICTERKGKRFCPAKGEKICSLCCGIEREQTIDCPFDCSYLRESREHDYQGLDPKDFPHQEIRIEAAFLREQGALLNVLGLEILEGTLRVQGATDLDVRQALEALIQSYKTRESGLYYDSRPDSALARPIADHVRRAIEAHGSQESQQLGFSKTRDSDVLALLVFLYRMALDRDNHRRRGKAFLDFLRLHFRPRVETGSPLIVPGR